MTSSGKSTSPPTSDIHCERAGSLSNTWRSPALTTTAGRGLNFGSSLRETSCQCGSGSPSFRVDARVEQRDRHRLGHLAHKRALLARSGEPPWRPVPAEFDAGRFVRLQAKPPWSLGAAVDRPHLDLAPKTCAWLMPDLSTSTPNSVPRSVTVAVGVRTEKRGRGKGEGGREIMAAERRC